MPPRRAGNPSLVAIFLAQLSHIMNKRQNITTAHRSSCGWIHTSHCEAGQLILNLHDTIPLAPPNEDQRDRESVLIGRDSAGPVIDPAPSVVNRGYDARTNPSSSKSSKRRSAVKAPLPAGDF